MFVGSGDACVASAVARSSHGTSRSGLGSLEKCFRRASWLLRLAELVITEPCGVLGGEPPVCVKQRPDTAVKSVWQISYESGVRAKFDSELEQRVRNLGVFSRLLCAQGDPATSLLPLCARQKPLARQSWVGSLCLEFGIRFRLPSLWVPVTY